MMIGNRLLFSFLILFSAVPVAFAQNAVKVPEGGPVLIDGKCKNGEWKNAAKVSVNKGYELFFMRMEDITFICIAPASEKSFIVDLYLSADDGKLYTLHASAKLGERVLEGDKWDDWTVDWNWWAVEGWWATTSRPNSFEKRTFLPKQAIEFQISRKRFGGKSWWVMFDISSDDSVIFPINADRLKSATWLQLNL